MSFAKLIQNQKETAGRDKVHTQLLIFGFLGICAAILDFGVYRIVWYLASSSMLAKACGYAAGTTFSILANHRWTFGKQGGINRIPLAFGLYLISLCLNIVVNQFFLFVLGRSEVGIVCAFLMAVGVCTVFNFIGLKFFVFRTGKPAPE